jgi:hypothetical protein
MDAFAIYGYAMLYIAAYIFKTEQIGNPKEKNLLITTFEMTIAASFYATGVLKLFGQGKRLPSARLYLMVMLAQIIHMPFMIFFLSREIQIAKNPIDASLEYQWRSIPQIVAFIKIYDKE